MFQLEKINALLNCKICKDVLVDPVLLPCGETICKAHTDMISKGKCASCTGTHTVPKEGFLENRILKDQLDYEINKINLNYSQFKSNSKIIQDLNEKLKEIVAIRNDPANYIHEYFDELTRQVDLRRETLIEDIHKYSDELVQNIEKLKQDCVAKSKETTKITVELETIKVKINELNSTLNSSEIYDIKLKEMMSKKKSKELGDLLGPVLKQCKFEIQGKKYYKLTTSEMKLENAFGSLNCFDYDIDNMRVTIVYYFKWVFVYLRWI